jgi:phosphatidylinositol 4-kinase A
MGETTDGGLYEIFQQDYGPVGSPSFETAREMFMISSAGYAVASLLLQPKDRHNGNLLFDKYALPFFALFVAPCIFWSRNLSFYV